MLKKFLATLFAFLCVIQSASAQGNTPHPFGGFFPDPTMYGTPSATYLVLSLDPTLTNERVLLMDSTYFTVTDGGANGNYQITLKTLPLTIGGTGGNTAQLGFNNLADGTAGAAAANGDILYRNAGNWTRLAKGSDGQYLFLASGLPSWTTAPTGAPTTSQYLTLALDAGLSAERVATAGSGISLTDAGANSTLTIAVDSTVVRTTGGQSVGGIKTFTNDVTIASGVNEIRKGSAFDLTLTRTDPGAAHSFNYPNIASGDFLISTGTQTIAGQETFTLAPVFSSGTVVGSSANTLTLPTSTDTLIGKATTDILTNKTVTSGHLASQVTLDQSSANYTVTWQNPAAGRAYTIREVATDAHFAMNSTAMAYTNGGVAQGNGNVLQMSAAGTSGQPFISGGAGVGSFATLAATAGGTGQTTIAVGDLLLGAASNTLSKLAIGANNTVLSSNGTTASWTSAGTGTVTNFSAGDLSPLFTTTEATTTTTPALSFALTATTAYKVFSETAGSTTPGYNTLVSENLPAGTHIFGGYGSNSSWRALPSLTGVVTLTGDYVNYGNVTDSGATSVTCNQCHIFNVGTFAITKVWTIGTENSGGLVGAGAVSGSNGSPGAGEGGGGGGLFFGSVITGGGGGGHAGRGGDSGTSAASVIARGGGTYPLQTVMSGSGGGGGVVGATSTPGAGAAGGGAFYLECTGNITISGTINADGGAGVNGSGTNGCGGGGGSGGTIDIRGNGSVNVTGGTLTAKGGAGGNATGVGGQGGGGGGGYVAIHCTGTYTAGTNTVTGGNAGTGGTGVAGAAGSAGDSSQCVGSAAYPGRTAP